MKKFLLLFCLGLISSSLLSQNNANPVDYWFDADESMIAIPTNIERTIIPEKYRTLAIDIDAMKTSLSAAPMEFTTAANNNPLIINLPLPTGENVSFSVVESPVMHPDLAARYPEIKSFSGVGVDNPLLRARIDYGPTGLKAMIDGPDGQIFIEPYVKGNQHNLIAFYNQDLLPTAEQFEILKSGHYDGSPTKGLEWLNPNAGGPNSPFNNADASPSSDGAPVELRVYRLALACTGEYGLSQGGNVTSVLQEMSFAVSRINLVFEKETAIRMELVPNNDELIYLNPSTDPYDGPQIESYIPANMGILNSTIGIDNYDIGHLFVPSGCTVTTTTPGNPPVTTTIGGVSESDGTEPGTVCKDDFKARGLSCSSNPSESFYLRTLCHEIGHQLGAPHPFSICTPTFNNQVSSGNAYSPGGGSTIMSYSGGCAGNSVQFNSDIYLHVNSVERIQDYTRTGNGNCGAVLPTGNIEPEVEIPFGEGVKIPISTPFELTGLATDANLDDTLTYCWEQYNLGPQSPLGSPTGNAPSFRSYLPTENPTRVFPRIDAIINNISEKVEVLPTYDRDLTFRCTVRDNKWGGGGTVWAEVSFDANDAAGPFLVEFPNSATTMEAGEYVEVLWDVANTNGSAINCQHVNIMLSTDGGYTYPDTLAYNVVNNGSFVVPIPNKPTNQARIKVKAADNIFFDISNQNSTITAPSQPGYSFSAGPFFQKSCLPEIPVYEINTESFLNYDSLVTFEVIGLPAEATASFSTNPVMASESSTLTISTPNTPTADGFFTFQLMAYVVGGDTIYQDLTYETGATDFSDFEITAPLDGAIAVAELPELSWVEANAADEYYIEIANDPSFSASSIEETQVVSGGNYTAGVQLTLGGVYFWRIRPQNECGQGDWSKINAFAIKSLSCASEVSTDGSMTISSNGLPTVESIINIPNGGTISDLNIVGIKGDHAAFKDLEMRLEGPDATSVVLFSSVFCLASDMDFGLDDQGAKDIGQDCPVDTGLGYKPENPLSVFNGKDAQGDWKLQVEVINTAGSGGKLEEWTLQLCSEANLSPPVLVNNELMPLPPAGTRSISPDFLLTEDPNNTPNQLTYTIVTTPQNGKLLFGTTELVVGSKFTQQSASAGNIKYEHDGTNTTTDEFTFTVDDGEGGLIATPQFNIELDPDIMINTEDLFEQNDISIFPNPANDIINVGFTKSLNDKISVRIFNVQGQLLQEKIVANSQELIQLRTKNFAGGIYFVQVRTENQSLTERVVIQR